MIVASPVKIGLMAQLLSNENIHEDRPNFGDFMVHHKHQPLHDKINPKDCQVLSLGDSGFLQFFRVVSSDYGKPRTVMVFFKDLGNTS